MAVWTIYFAGDEEGIAWSNTFGTRKEALEWADSDLTKHGKKRTQKKSPYHLNENEWTLKKETSHYEGV